MKRPILVALIGYIIGIIWELYFKINIAPIFIIIILINKKNYKMIIIILTSIVVSNIQIKTINKKYEEAYLSFTENETLTGIVESLEKSNEFNNTYIIKITRPNKYTRMKLLLKTKKILEYGDKIEVKGNYEKADIQRNYKGFDYLQYLRTKEIYGILNCKDVKIISKDNKNDIESIVYGVNKKAKENIKKIFDKKTANLLIGILIGDNKELDNNIIENFKNSGVYHILAISGTHISYIVIILELMINQLNIDKRIRKIILIIGIIFFTLVTNSGVSIIRAAMMTIMGIVANILYRKSDIVNNIAISMLVLLIINPFTILDISFQLSYGGVIGIILLKKSYENFFKRLVHIERVNKAISTILSAQTIIINILIYNYHTISLTFLMSNLLISIIIGPIIMMGFIILSVSFLSIKLAHIIAYIESILVNVLVITANFFGTMKLSKIYVTTPSIIYIIGYYVLILGLTVFKKKKYYNLIKYKKTIVLINIILIISMNIYKLQGMRVYFIDVGQGDSTLIVTQSNKKILIDTGGRTKESGYDIGGQIVLPYLLNRKIKKLDYVMISHFDSDHCEALLTIMDGVKISNLIISKQVERTELFEKIIKKAREKYINIILVKKGTVIEIDKVVKLNILYPNEDLIFDDMNNNSIVAKLNYKEFSILFTGDIEEKAERKIIELYQGTDILKSKVLKVAHHGSNTSTSEDFLNEVLPEIAIIGVGKNNKFGHPAKVTIERLSKIKTSIYRTDMEGEIIINYKKNKLRINKKINITN